MASMLPLCISATLKPFFLSLFHRLCVFPSVSLPPALLCHLEQIVGISTNLSYQPCHLWGTNWSAERKGIRLVSLCVFRWKGIDVQFFRVVPGEYSEWWCFILAVQFACLAEWRMASLEGKYHTPLQHCWPVIESTAKLQLNPNHWQYIYLLEKATYIAFGNVLFMIIKAM